MMGRVVLVVFCFTMALLSFLGVGTRDEPNGRLMFGLIWIGAAILGVIRYLMEKNKQREQDTESNSWNKAD